MPPPPASASGLLHNRIVHVVQCKKLVPGEYIRAKPSQVEEVMQLALSPDHLNTPIQ